MFLSDIFSDSVFSTLWGIKWKRQNLIINVRKSSTIKSSNALTEKEANLYSVTFVKKRFL